MSEQTTGAKCSNATSGVWKFTLALLLLRLCMGWHFFSEGTKKLTYDQVNQEWDISVPTEVVFRNATGPFANFYKNQLPGFYDWENLLAVPAESKPLTEEQIKERRDWASDYAKRRATASKEDEPLPIEFPEHAPYRSWAEAITEGMRTKLEKFTKLSKVDDQQAAEAASLFEARHQQLADFLEEEASAIEEYQHELWRLQNLENQNGADNIPFRIERVATKRSEASALGGRLVTEVRGIERGFVADLLGVLTPEQRANKVFNKAATEVISDPKAIRLDRMNLMVTCLIIGVGVCLLLGLFTRLACVAGMVFLASVMLTQLPWVPGALADKFYYQLVEFMALLTLLVSGPWRLPSLDGLLRGLWCMCCGSKGATEQKGN